MWKSLGCCCKPSCQMAKTKKQNSDCAKEFFTAADLWICSVPVPNSMAKVKNNYTYIIGLDAGAESGPLSFADIQPMLKNGKVTGATFIKRSDRTEWATAADFPELKIKDDVGGRDLFQADALTQEIEKELHLRKVRSGVSWLFWIGGLSLFNSVLAALGVGQSYAMGLGAAHLIAALGEEFGGSGFWLSLGANLGLSFAFLIVGVLAYHGRLWLLGPVIVVYVADAILCILFQQWLSVALHAWALFFLIPGFLASFEVRGVEKNWRLWTGHGVATAALAAAGFGGFLYLERGAVPDAPGWASAARSQWPLISVAHAAEFKGHTPLEAGNAFFVKLKDGNVIAATARHLIGPDGGVEPKVTLSELNAAITNWKLHARETPTRAAAVHGLHGASGDYGALDDWLFLKIAPEDVAKLPAEPLSPRLSVLKPGETVYLIGTGAAGTVQEIHEAKVSEADDWSINAKLEKPLNLVGFSGAPLIDAQGSLVGVLTGSRASADKDGRFPSFVADSVVKVKKLLR